MQKDEGLARFLGWFSIGLGLAGVTLPGELAQVIGLKDKPENRNWLRIVGAREITAGIGLLTQPYAPRWAWARVVGDAMDIALVRTALASPDAKQKEDRVQMTLVALVGITAVDLYASQKLSRQNGAATSNKKLQEEQTMQVKKAITINRSPEEVYGFWHDFQNLPRFMQHLEAVQTTGNGHSHWKAKAPAGTTVEWDAQITEDRPNQLIAWRSLEGAQVDNSGAVRMAPGPGGRGTEVRVELQYNPPAGKLGSVVAKLLGEEPEQQVEDDLRHFKQVMEVGEVVLSDATAAGEPHPAQPPANGVKGK